MSKVTELIEKSNNPIIANILNIDNDYIKKLNAKELFEIAQTLNRLLRNKNDKEEVLADNMTAGELVAPISGIRENILTDLTETLKNIDNEELRAELVYYTFINLHMFSDGNGRTSRLLYGLFKGSLDEDEEWYLHDDEKSRKNTGDFCTYMGLTEEDEINEMTSEVFQTIRDQEASINPLLSDKHLFQTYYIGAHGTGIDVSEIISPEILSELTDEEKQDISTILDDNEGYLSVAGLTMLLVTKNNNQLYEWIRIDNENTTEYIKKFPEEEWMKYRLSFNLKRNKKLLHEWKKEDWLSVINIGAKLKIMQFQRLNSIYLERNKIEHNGLNI